jgi:beta-RFAP synthase
MAIARVVVEAPSRLHCGMFSFGRPDMRRFGGLGMMIAEPSLRLSLEPAERFTIEEAYAQRVGRVVQSLVQAGWFTEPPACHIQIQQAPPTHVGLGSGTQLALAVAAGLSALGDRPARSPSELAQATGRGQRSAIGLHGFGRGGLLVEAGKTRREEISPLVSRVDLPSRWRFLLLVPRGREGLSGDAERAAFDRLPPVPRETTAELSRLALMELLPAAATADFDHFAAALFDFGRLAGSCFAAEQGGTYADPSVAAMVLRLREMGLVGVTQSSWGPTLAAILPDEAAAQQWSAELRSLPELKDVQMFVSPPANRGASVRVEE